MEVRGRLTAIPRASEAAELGNWEELESSTLPPARHPAYFCDEVCGLCCAGCLHSFSSARLCAPAQEPEESRTARQEWWGRPAIPATQRAEAGGSKVPDQPGQLNETLSQNKFR